MRGGNGKLAERWIAVECHWVRKRAVWLMESGIIYEYIPESFSSLLAFLIEFLLNLHQPSCCAVNWNEDFSPCCCIESSALNQKSFDPPISNSSLVQEFLAHYQRFFTRLSSRDAIVWVNSVITSAFSKLRLCECHCLPRESVHWKSPLRRARKVIHC